MNGQLRGGAGDIPDNIPPAPQQSAQSCQSAAPITQAVLCQPTSSPHQGTYGPQYIIPPPHYYASLPLRHARHQQRVDRTLPRAKEQAYLMHERYTRRLSPPVNFYHYHGYATTQFGHYHHAKRYMGSVRNQQSEMLVIPSPCSDSEDNHE